MLANIITDSLLAFPGGIYVLPIIFFILAATVSYHSKKKTIANEYYNNAELEDFEKVQPDWVLSIFVLAFTALIIFVIDFIMFISISFEHGSLY